MSNTFNTRRTLSWSLWLAMALALSISGCSCGDESVATDPTADDSTIVGSDDLEDVSLQEDPFSDEGSQTGQAGVDGEDLDADADAMAIELQDVFFDYDSFDLDATDRAALAANARLLKDAPRVRVVIEGHCDERGTLQYNLALGEKRARETKRYLVSLGVPADRIEIVSYGKERPFVVGNNEDAWSQNRRSHFVLRDGSR